MTRYLGLSNRDALRATNRRWAIRRFWLKLDIFDLLHGSGWR